jgi:phosphoglycolate phosphatase
MNFDVVDTVIFDLDGTLIDSAPIIANVLNDMRKQLGKRPLEIDFFRKQISRGAIELVATSLDIGINNATPYVIEFRQNYLNLPTPINSLYPGVLKTISALSNRGIKLGICSNKPEHLCRKVATETGLGKFIGVIVGGDTLSASKPGREPIDYVIQKLRASHESTVLVGDSTIDQRGAMAANIPFVFFRSGYDDGVDQTKALNVIDKITQLLDMKLFKNFQATNSSVLG